MLGVKTVAWFQHGGSKLIWFLCGGRNHSGLVWGPKSTGFDYYSAWSKSTCFRSALRTWLVFRVSSDSLGLYVGKWNLLGVKSANRNWGLIIGAWVVEMMFFLLFAERYLVFCVGDRNLLDFIVVYWLSVGLGVKNDEVFGPGYNLYGL